MPKINTLVDKSIYIVLYCACLCYNYIIIQIANQLKTLVTNFNFLAETILKS